MAPTRAPFSFLSYSIGMFHDIIVALWVFLPAALANASPIGVAAMPGLRRYTAPMDFHKEYRGIRLLGPHKTWRGIITGVITATVVVWLQQLAYQRYGWAVTASGPVDYSTLPVWLVGPLFGLGALLGDALKSFFKRQRGIPSGETWLPFDQLDYIIGGLLFTLPFVRLNPTQYVWVGLLWFGIHFIASYAGWLLKLKQRPI